MVDNLVRCFYDFLFCCDAHKIEIDDRLAQLCSNLLGSTLLVADERLCRGLGKIRISIFQAS